MFAAAINKTRYTSVKPMTKVCRSGRTYRLSGGISPKISNSGSWSPYRISIYTCNSSAAVRWLVTWHPNVAGKHSWLTDFSYFKLPWVDRHMLTLSCETTPNAAEHEILGSPFLSLGWELRQAKQAEDKAQVICQSKGVGVNRTRCYTDIRKWRHNE